MGFHENAVANVLSMAVMIDSGANVRYDTTNDQFVVVTQDRQPLVFARKLLSTGAKSNHYACDMAAVDILVETVAENMTRLTSREIAQAVKARQFMTDMGHCSSADTVELFKHRPPLNCDITATDVRNASAIWGATTTSALKGKTRKMKSAQAGVVLVPRVTQEAQWMEVDIFFIKKFPFLLGLLLPLGLSICAYLKTRKVEAVSTGIKYFLGLARSRGYEVTELRAATVRRVWRP